MVDTLERHAPPEPPAERRSRVGPIVVVIVVVAVVVGVLAAKWFNDSVLAYDQVGYFGGAGNFGGYPQTSSTAESYQTHTHELGTEAVFRYRPGAEFHFGFDLTNDGKRTIRVKALPPEQVFLADVTGVYISRGITFGYPPEPLIPFRPFMLRPHEHRWIEFRYRFEPCGQAGGGGSGWRSQRVLFAVAGISRSREFDLPESVFVEGMSTNCAGRQEQMRQREARGLLPGVDEQAVGVRNSKP